MVPANFANQLLGGGRRAVFDSPGAQPASQEPVITMFGDAGSARPSPFKRATSASDPAGSAQPSPIGDVVPMKSGASDSHSIVPDMSAADIVAQMEHLAGARASVCDDASDDDQSDSAGGKGKVVKKKPASIMKKPSAAMTSSGAKASSPSSMKSKSSGMTSNGKGFMIIKRPSGKTGKLLLGCGRCRGGPAGCLTCRNPNFPGHRYRKK